MSAWFSSTRLVSTGLVGGGAGCRLLCFAPPPFPRRPESPFWRRALSRFDPRRDGLSMVRLMRAKTASNTAGDGELGGAAATAPGNRALGASPWRRNSSTKRYASSRDLWRLWCWRLRRDTIVCALWGLEWWVDGLCCGSNHPQINVQPREIHNIVRTGAQGSGAVDLVRTWGVFRADSSSFGLLCALPAPASAELGVDSQGLPGGVNGSPSSACCL